MCPVLVVSSIKWGSAFVWCIVKPNLSVSFRLMFERTVQMQSWGWSKLSSLFRVMVWLRIRVRVRFMVFWRGYRINDVMPKVGILGHYKRNVIGRYRSRGMYKVCSRAVFYNILKKRQAENFVLIAIGSILMKLHCIAIVLHPWILRKKCEWSI